MSIGGGILARTNNRLSQTNSTTTATTTTLNCRSGIAAALTETIINETEFPSLGVRSSPSFNTSVPTTSYSSSPISHNQAYNRDIYNAIQRPPYANLMRAGEGSSGNSEFHIQNEDFPALPGATHLESTHSQLKSGNSDNVVQDARYLDRSNIEKLGIITSPDGLVKNIPPTMLADQFGMAGLLTFLRAIELDPQIVGLALGHDLTNLGLNLNAPERNVYATFAGPWSDVSCRVQDMDTKVTFERQFDLAVPDEYMTNLSIRDKLPGIKLNKLSEDVLFYLFYNCPGEIYQMAAANELYGRDWRFHKTQCVWLTRSQYGVVKEQTSVFERGSYNVFDPTQWRKIPKDMTLEYKELEDRPKLPPYVQQSTVLNPRSVMNPFNSQNVS